MSDWLDDAICEGVTLGFCGALADRCDGRYEPQERCEMRPVDGCGCLWLHYSKLPWWRKFFTEKPVRPDDRAVLSTLQRLIVEDVMSRNPAEKRRAGAAS